jgi:hypothetical protein
MQALHSSRLRRLLAGAALPLILAPSIGAFPALGQVTSVYGRTGVVTAQSGDYTCAQVTNCPPTGTSGATVPFLNGNNTHSGQDKFILNGTSTTSPTNYPVIMDAFAGLMAGPRNSTQLQIIGTPNITGDGEVNGVDAFGYNGELQYNAERWDRGTELANGSTSTSSPTLHVVSIPTTLPSGTTILKSDAVSVIGTTSGSTGFGSTTITLAANAAFAVSPGDVLLYYGPNNGAVQNGEPIGYYAFVPLDGSSNSNTGGLAAQATENMDNATGHHGTSLQLQYTPNAAGANKFRYVGITISNGGNGGVTVGDDGTGSHQTPPTDLGKGTLHVADSVVSGNHFSSDGAAPTVSSCGTSPSVGGTDNVGQVSVGGATSCTVNFHTAWANAPICIVQTKANATPVAYVSSVSTTKFVFSLSASLTGGVYYICQGLGGV